jgi:hypothetical protein
MCFSVDTMWKTGAPLYGHVGPHSQPHSGYEARTAPQRRQAGNAGDLTSMLEIAVGPHLYV